MSEGKLAGKIKCWHLRALGYSFYTHESALRQMLAREHGIKLSAVRMKRLLWLAEFLSEKLTEQPVTSDHIYDWYFYGPYEKYHYKSKTTLARDLSLLCKMGMIELTKPYPSYYWNQFR